MLEIGTFTGYAALSMAAALPEGGHVHTCDIEPRHTDVAQRYIDESPYGDRITIHLGPALETIAELEGDSTSSSSTPTRRTTTTTTRRSCRG